MKRIGILGGTFNPVHIGHLTIAEMVCELLKLDQVIFVPANIAPHKKRKSVVLAKDRYHMLKLAIKGNPKFTLSDFEIKKKGKSYSVDTVSHFKECFPRGTKFYFIIGSDLLPTLHTWRRVKDILKIVSFVAVNRPGYKEKKPNIKVKMVTMPGLNTSSSYLRRRITSGKTVKYLVPDSILKYIKQKRLYR